MAVNTNQCVKMELLYDTFDNEIPGISGMPGISGISGISRISVFWIKLKWNFYYLYEWYSLPVITSQRVKKKMLSEAPDNVFWKFLEFLEFLEFPKIPRIFRILINFQQQTIM